MAADWFETRSLAHSLGLARITPSETVELDAAAHRTLASDLLALAQLPGYSSSAMDGWVVSGAPPWAIGAPIATGDPVPPALAHGTARPIGTGGPLPPGATAVVRLERGVERDGLLFAEVNAGADIRLAGEEARQGESLLPRGSVLNFARLSLAASAGHDSLDVRARPTAELLVLGNEVVPRGIPTPGQVRDAFAPSLPAVIDRWGGRVVATTEVHDDLEATAVAIAQSSSDLVIVTGGSSRGVADHTRAAVRHGGGSIAIDGVRMRPGHPVMLGERASGAPVLCLPGNPLAGLLAFVSFGGPLILGMLGAPLPPLGSVELGADIAEASDDVRLVACALVDGRAIAVNNQGPGMTRGLALADCVVVVPPGGAHVGSTVKLLALL